MTKNHMKKWIPHNMSYCYGKNGWCKWWKNVTDTHKKNNKECKFSKNCKDDCSLCDEEVSYCKFLGKYDYGQYPLSDMCKICNVHVKSKKSIKEFYM